MELFGGTGNNSSGQLGDGTNFSSNEPVQVKIDKSTPLTNIVKISVGFNHVLALTRDGEVYAWGDNSAGELGNNSTTDAYYARKVIDIDRMHGLNNVVDISAGNRISTFLKSDGTVYSAGRNNKGQLGAGNTADSKVLVQANINNIISITDGMDNVIALRTNGNIWGWGYNGNGQLGIGNQTDQLTPVQTTGRSTIEISASGYTTIVKTVVGEVYGAGYNQYGQIPGLGITGASTAFTKVTLPSSVTGNTKVKYVSASTNNTSIVLTDGSLWISGYNASGQIGDGTNTQRTTFVQAKDDTGNLITNAKFVGGSMLAHNGTSYHTSCIRDDGSVYVSGANNLGQIGNGTRTDSLYFTKMEVPYLSYANTDIIIKPSETYQINRNDFRIANEFNTRIDFVPTSVGDLEYEILDDTKAEVNGTGLVTGLKEGFTRVKVTDTTNGYMTYIIVKVIDKQGEMLELGEKFSVGLKTSGEVWTWGSNFYGELGTGTDVEYKDTPRRVIVGTRSTVPDKRYRSRSVSCSSSNRCRRSLYMGIK